MDSKTKQERLRGRQVWTSLVLSLTEREKKDNKIYMCDKKEKKRSYFNPSLVLFLPMETEKYEQRGL
jgi:hypothetical protein